MNNLWFLLFLVHQVTVRKLTKEENEKLKEKCSVKPSVAARAKRRQPVEAFAYPFAVAFSQITVYDGYIDFRNGRALEGHSRPICSGVLISPRHIVTAAHCIIDSENSCSHNLRRRIMPVENIGFFFQSDCKETECWAEENPRKTASIFLHPKYETCQSEDDRDGAKQAQNDIAIVELRKNVNIAPICMPKVDSVISNQEEFESIGYGEVDGQRRIQSVRYEKIEEAEVIFAYNMNKKNDVVRGDSGGPLIRKWKGRHYLFGITTRAIEGHIGHSEQEQIRFFAGGYFTDVRKHLGWICDVSGVCAETTNRVSQFHRHRSSSNPWDSRRNSNGN